MSPDREAIYKHLDRWKQALMGPIVGIPILLWEHLTGRPLTWAWFLVLVLAALDLQFYRELKAKPSSPEYPKVYLRYEKTADTSIEDSGFFLEVEKGIRRNDVFTVSSRKKSPANRNAMGPAQRRNRGAPN
jgi:hypothetical protein